MAIRTAILNAITLSKFNEHLWDGFRVPGDVDRGTVIDTILLETSEMSCLYADSDAMQFAIKNWTDKNYSVWEELWKTLQYEYNPIHNYDREGHWKDKNTERHVETPNITTTDDYERNLTTDSTTNTSVAAYNNGLADSTREVLNGNDGGNSNNTNKRSGTIKNDADDILQHDEHVFGNIGVTSTQQLIEAQRRVVQFNLIDYIVNDYKRHLCIMC